MIETNKVYTMDVLEYLVQLEDESVQTVVTSPPYWQLRDYKVAGQIGLEGTVEEYLFKMESIFREVRRVLRTDGTAWVNMGDNYASEKGSCSNPGGGTESFKSYQQKKNGEAYTLNRGNISTLKASGLKPKDLVGMPWRLALALQASGWWLRSDIIWEKTNPMPESVQDRPTRSHEYLFLLTKSDRYYYNAKAIKEPMKESTLTRLSQPTFSRQLGGPKDTGEGNRSHLKVRRNQKEKLIRQEKYLDRHQGYAEWLKTNDGRNKRTVWRIGNTAFAEAHFATFPQELVEPCILAGSRPGDIVLDPFMGAATTALVALRARRRFMGCDLNPAYVRLGNRRIAKWLNQQELDL